MTDMVGNGRFMAVCSPQGRGAAGARCLITRKSWPVLEKEAARPPVEASLKRLRAVNATGLATRSHAFIPACGSGTYGCRKSGRIDLVGATRSIAIENKPICEGNIHLA
jgi:hypothetical protein